MQLLPRIQHIPAAPEQGALAPPAELAEQATLLGAYGAGHIDRHRLRWCERLLKFINV